MLGKGSSVGGGWAWSRPPREGVMAPSLSEPEKCLDNDLFFGLFYVNLGVGFNPCGHLPAPAGL